MKRPLVWSALAIVLAIGGAVRVRSAARAPLVGIEAYEFIPTAMTLTWDHHPIRAAQHGAVPAYAIRVSGLLFGDSTPGLRMMSVVAGVATIWLLYLIAARWWGGFAGVAAAGLLAVERYHSMISARAIDLPFDLFFVTLGIYCFSRFLAAASSPARFSTAGRWLYGMAAASAAGFLCKEFTALMMPVMFLGLLVTAQRTWLRRREPWLAAVLFALLLVPDVYSSLTVTQAVREDLFARQKEALRRRGGDLSMLDYDATGLYMSHGDQLSRFRAIGFDEEPFYFYFGDILERTGAGHDNEFDEFPYMYPVEAAVLWIGIAVALVRRRDPLTVFLLVAFAVTFVPFTLVQLGPPRAAFETDDRALWYWVDRTMLPAMLLTAGAAGAAFERWVRGAGIARRDDRRVES